MNFLKRAALGLDLLPAERSWLRLFKSFALNSIIAILPMIDALVNAVTTGHFHLNWAAQWSALGIAFASALLHAAAKYYSALGEMRKSAVATDVGNLAADVANVLPVTAAPSIIDPSIASATTPAA